MKATLTACRDCAALRVSLAATGKRPATVPGTGDLKCGHMVTEGPDTVDVDQIVHVALSTLLRAGDLDEEPRRLAHVVQERLNVPERRRSLTGIPYVLTSGYGVSSEGLAVARILAAAVAKIAEPSDAFYWRAAVSIMRRKLSDVR